MKMVEVHVFKKVRNNMEKGEIACYKQFLLFPKCFQEMCNADMENKGLFGKGLKCIFFFPQSYEDRELFVNEKYNRKANFQSKRSKYFTIFYGY